MFSAGFCQSIYRNWKIVNSKALPSVVETTRSESDLSAEQSCFQRTPLRYPTIPRHLLVMFSAHKIEILLISNCVQLWFVSPIHKFPSEGTRRNQKEPEGTRRNQKEPEGTRRNQKEPGGFRINDFLMKI